MKKEEIQGNKELQKTYLYFCCSEFLIIAVKPEHQYKLNTNQDELERIFNFVKRSDLSIKLIIFKMDFGLSRRIHLSCRRHRFEYLGPRRSHAYAATKSVHHNCWANCTWVPRASGNCNTEAHALQLLKPVCPRACTVQQEKAPQWEAHTLQLANSCCSW